jgi:hypothetical protein
MKLFHTSPRIWIVAAVAALLFGWLAWHAPQARAHEDSEVGDYELHFGWQLEPAYVGVYNGIELTIHNHATEENVEGAEKTLKLKVTFGNQSKELKLEPVADEPGRYVAALTPTRAGDYKFVFTGKIEDVTVNKTFDSADGEFSTIEPASDILFPDTKLDLAAMQTQIDALKAEVEKLKSTQK